MPTSDASAPASRPALAAADILGASWMFAHESDPTNARPMQFREDGRITPAVHPNEARWRIEGGDLLLIAEDGQESARLSPTEGPPLAELRGPHLLDEGAGIRFILSRLDWNNRAPRNETRRLLASQIRDRGWRIGAHSYGAPALVDDAWADLHIGKFVSIAGGVVTALGNHRIDTVSTYPFASVDTVWPSVSDEPDHSSRGDIVIGNDVWIGMHAFITSGVTIGDGAVIGAHALVTRDVPPYAIVGGNPARVIRYRFSEDQIAALLAIRWWDWPDETVDRYLPLIMGRDIDAFIRAARQEPLELTVAMETPA